MPMHLAIACPDLAEAGPLADAAGASDLAVAPLDPADLGPALLHRSAPNELVAVQEERLDPGLFASWCRRGLEPDRPGLILLTGGAPAAQLGPWMPFATGRLDLAADPESLAAHLALALRRQGLDLERARAWPDPAGALPGPSSAMARARAALERAAERPHATVWIEGPEDGTERAVALAVHARSARASGPFRELRIDPGAAGEIRAALERGYAGTPFGTLWLHPLEELGRDGQRLLNNMLTTPGAARPRLLVGASVSPQELLSDGRLESQLSRRLNVLRIPLPPAEIGPQDLEHVCRALLGSQRRSRTPPALGADALAWLAERGPWSRGRLAAALDAVLRVRGEAAIALGAADLDAALPGGAQPRGPLEALARREIERVLAACGGNKSQAARQLGIHRATLHSRLRRYSRDGG